MGECPYLEKILGRYSCTAVSPRKRLARRAVKRTCIVEDKYKKCPSYTAKTPAK